MKVISIIVPVYKVREEYLRQCIESLVNQTYEKIEIILVNDGTPDKGGEICNEYAEKDNRIKVIHQENQGVSVARNNGIDKATGDWITFVDADDWIELDSFEKLSKRINDNNMDLLLFSLNVNVNDKELKNPFWDEKYSCLSREDLDELQIQLLHKSVSRYSPPITMIGVAVCKLYKTDFLKEHDLRFNSDLALSEDGLFAFWAFELAETVYYVDEYLYHYRKHPDSATNHYRENAQEDYTKGTLEFERALIQRQKDRRHFKALNYRILLNIFAICNQQHCNKQNKKSSFAKVKDIKKLCNLEHYKKAIKETKITTYFRTSGIMQRWGFILIKISRYFMLYHFLNAGYKIRNYKK